MPGCECPCRILQEYRCAECAIEVCDGEQRDFDKELDDEKEA